MPYTELDRLISKIPKSFLTESLDDDGDGCIDDDVWAAIQLDVDDEIDGVLGQRFTVPLTSPPKLIKNMARVFALDAIYQRRGFITAEENPWFSKAEKLREKLDRIANSEEPLFPGKRGDSSKTVHVISEPARTHSNHGNLST